MSALQALTTTQAQQLEEAIRLLNAGNASAAVAISARVVAAAPLAPDAQHLHALCCADMGDAEAAERAFQRALALAQQPPLILRNYVAFLCKSGLSALAAGLRVPALAVLERAVQLQPDSALAWHALGNAQRMADDLEAAEVAFRKAIALTPGYATAWVNLGAIVRLLGRSDEAITCYEQAVKAGYVGPDLTDALTGVLIDVGRVGEALVQARRVTREHPEFVPAHTTLANLLWEYGSTGVASDSAFLAAVHAQPGNSALRLAFAQFLLASRQADAALEQIRLLKAQEPSPVLIALEADALEMLGHTDQAGALYAQAHRQLGGDDPVFLNTYARHLLRAGEWQAAAERATEATMLDPGKQEAWANLATAWRLLGDPREFWLCDYQRLITMVDIETPPEFATTAEFLAALTQTLEALHTAKREPVQQSLRGGSQTAGRLFGRRDPIIEATRLALRQAVERWLATLPSDASHPFLKRKARSVRFSGSWSVRLWSSGNHVNHIHPQGWMSSAFYVALPPSVTEQASESSNAGYIKFGQPPQELNLNLPPRRLLRPEPGKLALFPSYLWHGTVPFVDDAARLTVAFDMIPSQDSP